MSWSLLPFVLASAVIWALVLAAICLGICSYICLGLCCYMSWSLQLYDPGSQLLYILVSAAIWTWVTADICLGLFWISAALCLGRCRYVGLCLSCFMSLSLQLLGLRQEDFYKVCIHSKIIILANLTKL